MALPSIFNYFQPLSHLNLAISTSFPKSLKPPARGHTKRPGAGDSETLVEAVEGVPPASRLSRNKKWFAFQPLFSRNYVIC